jgi:hypothetical protein
MISGKHHFLRNFSQKGEVEESMRVVQVFAFDISLIVPWI